MLTDAQIDQKVNEFVQDYVLKKPNLAKNIYRSIDIYLYDTYGTYYTDLLHPTSVEKILFCSARDHLFLYYYFLSSPKCLDDYNESLRVKKVDNSAGDAITFSEKNQLSAPYFLKKFNNILEQLGAKKGGKKNVIWGQNHLF